MNILEAYGVLSEGCPCGKTHATAPLLTVLERGALLRVAEVLGRVGICRPFVLSDPNTERAAGARVKELLCKAGIPHSAFVFPEEHPTPDENSLGKAAMAFAPSDADGVLVVGSGVLGDIGKLLSRAARVPMVTVATAPSMDGYASSSSSMEVAGLKTSVPSRCPDAIIGDLDVLAAAPMPMLRAGLGDMLAKYVSLAEWRIAKIAVGEYYCDKVADAVTAALDACVKNAEGLLRRDTEAVRAVVEGLILSGLAMTAAGLSRPASGEEHYISHLWDMRGLSFGTKVELHGLQCAVGTRIAVGVYEKLRAFTPDREKALASAAAFDREAWEQELRSFLGHAAEPMIALEAKEGKYDREKHKARLDTLLAHWEEIRKEICSLPTQAEIDRILDAIGAPKTPEEMGIDPQTVPVALRRAGDIRDKYVLSRLLWDLGISPAAEE